MNNNGPFFSLANDKGLTIILKEEANIKLASLDRNTEEYTTMFLRFKDAIEVCKAIEKTEPQCNEDIDFIIDTLNAITTTGILSPLTLRKDEFCQISDNDGKYRNNRYTAIYLMDNDMIYNGAAFNCHIRAAYNHNNCAQIENKFTTIEGTRRVYVSKGGVVTGEYIEECIIRQDIVDKHCFTIQGSVNIPVCKIIDNDSVILVVDHREPKLKVLNEFYEVPVHIDYFTKSCKYNLRKYKKLEK